MKKYYGVVGCALIPISDNGFQCLEEAAGVRFDAQRREAIQEAAYAYEWARAYEEEGFPRGRVMTYLEKIEKHARALYNLIAGMSTGEWKLDEASNPLYSPPLQSGRPSPA